MWAMPRFRQNKASYHLRRRDSGMNSNVSHVTKELTRLGLTKILHVFVSEVFGLTIATRRSRRFRTQRSNFAQNSKRAKRYNARRAQCRTP